MKARKRFAQHFLEPAWVTKIVAAVGATGDDRVVEIGPGRGAITRPLAATAGRLLAIEVDRDLAAALERSRPGNVTVVSADVLELDWGAIIAGWLGAPPGPERPVRIVGNLPYNISSPILFRLLDFAAATGGVEDATLMLQKEVADRLVARVGTRDYGVLTVLTSLRADVTRVLTLPPGAFRPSPKVMSAVVRLGFRPRRVPLVDEARFVRMVRSMFTQRRKVVSNALGVFAAELGRPVAEVLAAAGVDGRRRPETLSLDELAALAKGFAAPGS